MKVMYTYARHEDEEELCELELRSLFGQSAYIGEGVVSASTDIAVTVNRSPFFKRRLEVQLEAETLPELTAKLPAISLGNDSFKVLYTDGDERFLYEEQREVERLIGASMRGKADMRNPVRRFGIMRFEGKWLFGLCEDSESIWLKHQRKPQNYSTALPTRAARAIVNIAAGGSPAEKELIDPCCGMGTVLIEALSMGIKIAGLDINPLAVRGARVNLAHYGYPDVVRLGDMREEQRRYDAAIVDMPYNLCSVLTGVEGLEMLHAVRKMASRAVIVTTEEVTDQLKKASLRTIECTLLRKGSFTRYISVVE